MMLTVRMHTPTSSPLPLYIGRGELLHTLSAYDERLCRFCATMMTLDDDVGNNDGVRCVAGGATTMMLTVRMKHDHKFRSPDVNRERGQR